MNSIGVAKALVNSEDSRQGNGKIPVSVNASQP